MDQKILAFFGMRLYRVEVQRTSLLPTLKSSINYLIIKSLPSGATTVAPKIKIGLLLCVIWLIVNRLGGPDTFEIKYLEKGHAFMRPDAVHGAIRNKMKS